jgi:uncharacterized cofD-like protein
MGLFKWLYPGMKVKRWLLLALVGLFVAALGVDLLMKGWLLGNFARPFHRIEDALFGDVYRVAAGVSFIIAGIGIMVVGILRVFNSIADALTPGQGGSMADVIYARRSLKRGPKIVVIGGGTGISMLLRGLKDFTSNLTAIVTVADDGGSSGRLRGDLGILPPGDIRNCLVALADKEPLMEELLQYRFSTGELAGHSMGNLLLAALTDMTGGFDQAVRSMSKVLALRGQVLPATLSDVTLCAELTDGRMVQGESKISSTTGTIKRIYLKPSRCLPLDGALLAIAEADAIVLGPGSLFTSLIPNLLVRGIPEALTKTRAIKIYVCNVMTQTGETDGFTASSHLKAIVAHAGNFLDYMILNTGRVPLRLRARYRQGGAEPVTADISEIEKLGVEAIGTDLIYRTELVRHHPEKLAGTILRLIYLEKTQQEQRRHPKNRQDHDHEQGLSLL